MTVTPYTLKMEYRLECKVCPTVHVEHFRLLSGSVVPFPSLPTGWRAIEGRLYCAAHSVTVVVDP